MSGKLKLYMAFESEKGPSYFLSSKELTSHGENPWVEMAYRPGEGISMNANVFLRDEVQEVPLQEYAEVFLKILQEQKKPLYGLVAAARRFGRSSREEPFPI